MDKAYHGPERRQFVRLEYVTPLDFKVCKPEIIAKLLKGYTSDISQKGILCSIKQKVNPGDILWLSFDKATLVFCEELEKDSFIYQSGIIGKAVRIEEKENGAFHVGVQFLTRQDKYDTHIYPKIHFLDMQDKQQGQGHE